jgi:hypothetical protein
MEVFMNCYISDILRSVVLCIVTELTHMERRRRL